MTDHLDTSDPTRMRALAHPLRLRLMELLGELGEATATTCADRTGESVASCSFHLRQLAKYGFVEAAEQRGREKPWRRTARHLTTRPDVDVPGSLEASGELARIQLASVLGRADDALRRLADEPPEWLAATTLQTRTLWVTASELQAVNEAIDALLEPYVARVDDPGARPPDARRARAVALTHPLDPAPGTTEEPS